MKFGEKILSSQHPPWAGRYIDYQRLKRLLDPLFDRLEPVREGSVEEGAVDGYGGVQNGDASDMHRTVSVGRDASAAVGAERVTSSHGFQKELNLEIQKALLFLMKTMGEMASDLSALADQRRQILTKVQSLLAKTDSLRRRQLLQQRAQEQIEEIEALRMEYLLRVGNKLLLLLEFVELNVEAIVKIVKKHDKFLSRWEESGNATAGGDKSRYTRLRRQYLPRFAAYSSNPNVRCLFLAAADAGRSTTNGKSEGNFGGWDVVQWNLETALKELFRCERDLQDAINDRGSERRSEVMPPFKPISSRSFSEIPLSGVFGSPVKKVLTQPSLLQALSSHPAKENDEPTFFEPIVYQIQSNRRRLGQMHSRYIRMVYAHEMLHLIDENVRLHDDKYLIQRRGFGSMENMEKIRKQSIGGEDEGKALMDSFATPTVSKLSKFLNLASAGLYMCNYNIVAPTSGLYAKLLGFDEANAGIIIGMTPTAVILSSVLYSWWSSYSYKRALMFASCCCMVGNAVYALALPCNSLNMVFLGRLLTGFGSARVINRRYIADYYSIEDRTSGMSDFVSASALGMALGPGLAASLSIVAPAHLSDSNSLWTIETAPGYIMLVLWSIYLICNVLFFEEPDRMSHTTTPAPSTLSERSNLLSSPRDGALSIGSKDAPRPTHPLWRSCTNIPVLISLVLLVLLKSVLEGISSSAPTVGAYYFDWKVHGSGIYLALLASFVLPTNFVVAHISRRYDDRELMLGTLVVMFFGILGFLVYSENGIHYSETRYILFGLIIFAACNALEGPTMGLLSKTIPKSLAKGILNAGLLATEAGTLGRVVGDFWLSAATYMGKSEMLNRTFEPMCAMVGVSIVATYWTWPHLQPRFEDEDDD